MTEGTFDGNPPGCVEFDPPLSPPWPHGEGQYRAGPDLGVTVPLFNDALVESTERFLVMLTNATGGAVLGTRKGLSVSIQDNDLGLHFASESHKTVEDIGEIGLVVTLDLYAMNGDDAGSMSTVNQMFHNNGNDNAWLTVKLVGTASNRDAVGAKVRARAIYAGEARWQRRDISGGERCNGNHRHAHFGLGDVTQVDTLRIEWPSGIVQELTDVAVNQQLQVVESQDLNLPEPLSIQNSALDAEGVFHATVNCPVEGAVCVLESSASLERWTKVKVGTVAGGTVELTDAHATQSPTRFYRVSVP